MSIFSSIKSAILGKKDNDAGQAQPTPTPSATAYGRAPVTQSQAVQEVDVEQKLDSMPGANNLNWRDSIVDLMKLLGIDASYENRKELASELGRSEYSGSAEDNVWLHKRTMKELAANGGRVPAKFQD